MHEPGRGDRIYADFEAKLLAQGQPSNEDPAEEHMNNVKKLVLRWTATIVVIAGASLWIGGAAVSVAVAAGVTLIAIVVLASLRRRGAPAR